MKPILRWPKAGLQARPPRLRQSLITLKAALEVFRHVKRLPTFVPRACTATSSRADGDPHSQTGLPMYVHTPEATAARRPADRLAGSLAAVALAAAVIALAPPVSSSGRSPGAAGALAAALSDSHAVTTPARMSRPASADQGASRCFFGFLEYDWDPDAPGGVPGFDSGRSTT